MVSAKCTRSGIATHSLERSPRRTRKSVLPRPSLRSDRRLRSSTTPNRPSPLTPGCEEDWLLPKALNVHQAIFPHLISPKDDIEKLNQLGTLEYISTLVEAAENSLDSSPGYKLTHQERVSRSKLSLQQRVERIQDRYGLKECPQYERPDLTASQAFIQLQRYESLSADYENRSPHELIDEPSLHALCFASRAFGALCYKLPPDMSRKDLCLSLLIPLYDQHCQRPMGILKNHYKQDLRTLFQGYDSILPQEPDQVGAPEE
ncbi:hypothetical protein BHE90_016948 [Fusarium euwallaceae]|uniref:Uncharacterized protein n=2 Tax=Fusarium solani species complex TaxID=232080 RepID=A0A428RVK4_9HYPO|nr:hypothetical protein CEP52_017171 [Fusarium oligoseptatum]RTE68678.1 hypothetical protein BHE90_016948 [Fusarium euwallaceae]